MAYFSDSGSDDSKDKQLPLDRAPKSLPSASHFKIMKGKELQALERLVAVAPARIACLSPDQSEREIAAILHEINDCCQACRCGLWRLNKNNIDVFADAIIVSQRTGTDLIPDTSIFRDAFPWTGEQLSSGNIVCFTNLDDLPPQADIDRNHYEALRMQSVLAIPLYSTCKVKYFISVHHVACRCLWIKEVISLLRFAGEIFVNALCRFDNRELDMSLQFERIISDLSVRFINATAKEIDQEIRDALSQVLDIFKADRCGLIVLSPDKSEAMITHAAYGEGIEAVPERIDISGMFPWAKERLLRGEMIHFKSPEELPPEAEIDRQSFLAMGTKWHLNIPIHVGGAIDYIFAIQDVLRTSRKISADLIPRLRLLGEIFVNSLVRCSVEEARHKDCQEIRFIKDKLQAEVDYLHLEIKCSHPHEEIIGQSEALARALFLAEKVAPTNSTVLISGETGTGKELIAKEVHKLSSRRDKILVKVNCASLPAALVESELFGRERGAYTGALTRQAGRFELADGGTIFLDEIAEMSPELQAKLLRILQEGEFERLGSIKTVKVDVRVLAATNRDLAEEVRKGNFRQDLYYRLNVFQIVVPPLRERLEDIPLLAWAFLEEFAEKMGKKINKIAKQDMAALQRYQWPGNVRELRNVVEHAVIVSSGDRLQLQLPGNGHRGAPAILTLEEYEITHIREALRQAGWRIKGEDGAARLLGLNPSTLYSRMRKLGISKSQ